MSRWIVLLSILLLLLDVGPSSFPSEAYFEDFTQDIVENPGKPLSQNAGRVLQLEEEFRITDEGGDFFFESPWEVKVDGNGFIYVREKDKLYKFDRDGKFIKNILNSGEGPGEVLELGSFELCGDKVILFCGMRNKIVRADLEGNLIQDIKLGEKRFTNLLAFFGKKYFLLDFVWENFTKTRGIRVLNHTLFTFDEEGKISSTPHSFPTKYVMTVRMRAGRGSRSISPITRIHTARVHPKYLYIAHTQDYLIKLFDLSTLQIVRIFRRKYAKVKHESQRLAEFLMAEYQNDVQNLLVHDDKLWVLTLTYLEGKGILVDVFNLNGEYLDNFYLPLFRIKRENLGAWPLTVNGDALFALEIMEDETLAFVKYRLVQ